MAKRFTDPAELIDFLGGAAEVAEMLGENRTTVSNWRTRGLPTHTFLTFQPIIKQYGISAPPQLWGMKAPD